MICNQIINCLMTAVFNFQVNVVRSMKFNSDGKTLFCGLHECLKVDALLIYYAIISFLRKYNSGTRSLHIITLLIGSFLGTHHMS